MLTKIEKSTLIEKLTDELPTLRAKIGITQEELCEIVGVSRQTYSYIETKKHKMSWCVFLSLIMFYTNNEKAAPIIYEIEVFPESLKNVFNINNR